MALSRPRKLLYGLIVCAIFLGALELALRRFTFVVSQATIPAQTVRNHVDQGAMKYHPTLGWVRAQLPNPALGLNAEGFRYPDVSVDKPAGTWRAFAMGDSQTYGAGVDWDEAYPARAESALREATGLGERVQLINAGISGYGSLQVLRLIREKLLDYDPDVLVVDCRTFDGQRETRIHALAGTTNLEKWLFYSRTYYWLRVLVERVRPNHARFMTAESLADLPPEKLGSGFGNHDLIADLADRQGIGLVFVNYPFWDERRNRIFCLAPDDELPKDAVVARACEALIDSGEPPSTLFLDNNHLTARGNELVGRALAKAILDAGLGPEG